MPDFSRTKPYNLLPPLPPKKEFVNLEIYKKVVRASDDLGALTGLLLSGRDNLTASFYILNPLFAPEAEASSRVENIITTTEEILLANALTEEQLTPQQKEGKGYLDALMQGFTDVADKQLLTTNNFIKLQKMIVVKGKGLRKLPGTQIANEKTGEVYYTPPEGEKLIRDKLKSLEDYINTDNDDIDPLIKMALIHYQFEAIHPFYDGNGRTGRIIMPLYLVLSGKTRFPVLFISGYILKNKDNYYRLIREVTEKENWIEWVDFILEGVIQTSQRTSKMLIEIRHAREKDEEKMKNMFPTRYTQISKYIYNTPYFTRNMMQEELELKDRHTVAKYAEALVEADILKKIKKQGSWIYINVKLVKSLQDYAKW
jgi:Fic family protein